MNEKLDLISAKLDIIFMTLNNNDMVNDKDRLRYKQLMGMYLSILRK